MSVFVTNEFPTKDEVFAQRVAGRDREMVALCTSRIDKM
jgi:hypothetical protein